MHSYNPRFNSCGQYNSVMGPQYRFPKFLLHSPEGGMSNIEIRPDLTNWATSFQNNTVKISFYRPIYRKLFYNYHMKAISKHHSNEIWSINSLHEYKLCNSSRTREKFCFRCIVSILWVLIIYIYWYVNCVGTRYSWLRHYVTSRKIVGSIPDEVNGFFQLTYSFQLQLWPWGRLSL
jgi:hypothetical protein